MTNIAICASQVAASRKTTIVLWARVGRLPTTQAGHIGREVAGAVSRLGQAEHHQRAGRDEGCVQSLR